MKHARVTLRWDDVRLGEQTLTSDNDRLDLDKWGRIDLRLYPELVGRVFKIYESTLFVVTYEKTDSAGRKLTR